MSDRDYYDVLGVERTVDPTTLKSAYRKLAKQYHPDCEGGCEETFKQINEAYAILSDPEKRAQYDRFGRAAFNGAGAGGGFNGDFSDIFAEVFGDAFGDFFGQQGGRRQGPQRGSDLRYDLEITLEDAFKGLEKQINVPAAQTCEGCKGSGAAEGAKPETCTTCHGQGALRANQGFFRMMRTCPTCAGAGQMIKNPCRACGGRGAVKKERTLSVKIPAGVEDGMRIRLAGEGDAGGRGASNGDLYIFLGIKAHKFFERDGADLYCRATVPMATAALGGKVDVPTIDGAKESVTIPEGAQTGRRFRVKGGGMSTLRGSGRGDLHIEIAVETPVNLNAKQKKLLREFQDACGANESPSSHGFLTSVKRFFDAKGE
jgi:molecular chaperone DnaJ